mmetsp:Transcript_10446/g.33176  ORF Transcript_10446/g.33176 Transcript_10446/m.33176 type:complete len:274 (-) Transcript_10446:1005-1826(-)
MDGVRHSIHEWVERTTVQLPAPTRTFRASASHPFSSRIPSHDTNPVPDTRTVVPPASLPCSGHTDDTEPRYTTVDTHEADSAAADSRAHPRPPGTSTRTVQFPDTPCSTLHTNVLSLPERTVHGVSPTSTTVCATVPTRSSPSGTRSSAGANPEPRTTSSEPTVTSDGSTLANCGVRDSRYSNVHPSCCDVTFAVGSNASVGTPKPPSTPASTSNASEPGASQAANRPRVRTVTTERVHPLCRKSPGTTSYHTSSRLPWRSTSIDNSAPGPDS